MGCLVGGPIEVRIKTVDEAKKESRFITINPIDSITINFSSQHEKGGHKEEKHIDKEEYKEEEEDICKYKFQIKNYNEGSQNISKNGDILLYDNGKFDGEGEDVNGKFKIKGIIKIMGEVSMEKRYSNRIVKRCKGKLIEGAIEGSCDEGFGNSSDFKIELALKKYLSNKSFLGSTLPISENVSMYGLAYDESAFEGRGAWGIMDLGAESPDHMRSGRVHFFNNKDVPVKMKFDKETITLEVKGRQDQVYNA